MGWFHLLTLAGYIASLGIMSAWEPCGGILCANLPLVYRSILHGFGHLRSSLVSPSRRRTTNAGGDTTGSGPSKRSSKRVLSNDWQRLEGGGGLGGEENHTVSEVYAFKKGKGKDGQSYEMDDGLPVVRGKIVVQRTLHQELDM